MSKVHNAAKKAARQADKIHEEVYGKNDGTVDPDAILDDLNSGSDDGSGDNPAGGDNPPAAEGATKEEPTLTIVPGEEPPAELAADAEPPIDPTTLVDSTELLNKAEHKYSVLQGMHRKLLDENNELRGRLDALEAAPAAPVEPSPVNNSLITDADVDDYGSDLIGMVKRAAHEEISPELAKLRDENTQLRNQMTSATSKIDTQAKADIYGTLATEVPDWEQINNSEDYLFWLAQTDKFSGVRRHDLLTQAFKDNDSARVVSFFNAFLDENMTVTPPEPAAAAAAPVEPKVDLMSMAAPGRAQSAGKPNNQTDSRVYTRGEIAAHYKAVQVGKFGGTKADKNRIEKAYILAANEGRVV